METILYTEFGSTVYGSNTPTSDKDYKSIFIPNPKDILLQRAPKTIVQNTKKDKNARNTKDDIDIESFALHQYLELLMQGQTVALDILFTPRKFWSIYKMDDCFIFDEIKRNKDKFLHSGVSSFVGYTRQQAAKYGIRGTRVAAMRQILNFLEPLEPLTKLHNYLTADTLPKELENEYIKIVIINGAHGQPEPHLEVCNRKIPFHATIKYTKACFQKIFDEYGHRALQAEKNEGVDWKALYHAVRVCHEARELLQTGNITFPRPEKELLLKIRKGEMNYKDVAEIIEVGLYDLEDIKSKSILRKEPDREFAEEFIEYYYSRAILNEYAK